MTTKVTLPADVATAIDAYFDYNGNDHGDLLVAHGDESGWGGEYEALNKIDIMTLASALVNGYEVEQTPEDKLREYYGELIGSCDRYAVECTLSILGITIAGINGKEAE